MNRRLSGDASLNAPIRASEGESGEWQDWLVDDHDSAEAMLIEQDELARARIVLVDVVERRVALGDEVVDEWVDRLGKCDGIDGESEWLDGHVVARAVEAPRHRGVIADEHDDSAEVAVGEFDELGDVVIVDR